ncbi:hypothetical protein BCR33DRAFT_718543 [Rhizoclosmatium globosum]|uniref:Guanylate cyclase domain-containing protein n=1 Tax=Rhizoclosmatium globosum TaxID=329046 RepID=A0A1Y2C4Q8_9FUNG|nr:hypothetical protein BCR33DRAFT_718543 [Rhizoclosmatium globosum]|eukprot:ORY41877.1 hypothetical protein BCR33DRAFT_718543 [Rhizoclosmatium globosum]
MKTSRFVARYIRDASRNRAKRTKIMDLLEKDQPFDEETVGAVALIDISGFTALTSTLLRVSDANKQQIIDIISYYGGDVIKFLGDALLIVFEAKSGSTTDLRYTTRRALICCTEVLIKGKTKSVSANTNGATKKKTFEVDEDLLDLHIGLSAGSFHHVIVGVAGQRCDYFVHGPPLGEIGGALDNARPECSRSLELPESIYSQIKIRKYETKGGSQTCEFKSLEVLQTQLSLLEPARLDFLEDNRRKASGADYTPTTESQDLVDEIKQSMLLNQSLVHKVKNLQNSSRLGVLQGYDLSSKHTITSATSSVSPGQMNTSASVDDDELITTNKYGPSSEYRRVTIMFIKFRFSYTKMRAHQLFSVLIKGLMPYDGVTQQFSVDDKGQSFFAVFGLPPWSHENNAVFAVRAAITVSDMLKSQGLTPFTIGLSTGDLLFSHMGSTIRSEAGLLGDVVNVAARLMIFNKAEGYNIFCDYDTHEATSELYQHAEIGLHMLKGKLEPVSIWAIKNSKSGVDNLKINHKDKRNFGYAEEKAKVNSIFSKWIQDKQQAVLIVEGPSGMGKTSLLESAMSSMSKNDAKIIVIRGSEIERMNALYPIKNLMRSVYQIFGKLNEADKAAMTRLNAPEIPFEADPSGNFPQITIEVDPASPVPPAKSIHLTADTPVEKKKSQKKALRKQPLNASMISIDESIESTRNFILACGENPDLVAVLSPVMDWIGDQETSTTRAMDPEERKTLLSAMIVKIMKAMTDAVKIAILCDDLQFMDSTTLDLLCTIIKTTSKTLYFLFSRPFTIYKLTAVQNLQTLPSTTHIALNGLSLLDTQKMLVWKFRDLGATSIDKEFLRVIHSRSSGSPFFLDKLADTLLATLPRAIACDDKGVVSTSTDIDYQEILAINVESAILVTFDQLDHHFQELLRVASISAVIDGNYPADDLIQMAESLDMFSFLTPAADDPHNSPTNRTKYKYCFTHMLSEIHRRIAKYLEDQLNSENRACVLPSIAFHYSNTSEQDKMYVYFEMLGLECVDRFQFQEGISALARLIHMYEAEKKNESSTQMRPIRQAAWYSALAYAESGKKLVQNARKNALKAMTLIEATWPETEAQYNDKLKENSRKQNMLWLKSFGGRRAIGEANPEKDRIMFRCLSVLHTLASLDPTLPPKDLPLANLSYLNLSIGHGQQYRPEFVDGCLKSAEWHWLANNKYLSNIYLQQGKKLSNNLVDYESFLYSPGAYQFIKAIFAKKRKDMSTYHLTQVFIATTLMTLGKLEDSYNAAVENCREVESNDLHVMTLFYAVSMEMSSVFLDKADDAAKYSSLIMSKSDYVATPLTKVFLGSTFQDMINAGMALMTAGQHFPMQLFGYCAIFPFLYFTIVKDADAKKIQTLIETLNVGVGIAKKLWMVPCVEGAASFRMYLAGQLLLQGKADIAMSVLAKACQGTILKTMPFIQGLHLAVLARFTTNEPQKQKYTESASLVLSQSGMNGLLEWAKGGEYGFK